MAMSFGPGAVRVKDITAQEITFEFFNGSTLTVDATKIPQDQIERLVYQRLDQLMPPGSRQLPPVDFQIPDMDTDSFSSVDPFEPALTLPRSPWHSKPRTPPRPSPSPLELSFEMAVVNREALQPIMAAYNIPRKVLDGYEGAQALLKATNALSAATMMDQQQALDLIRSTLDAQKLTPKTWPEKFDGPTRGFIDPPNKPKHELESVKDNKGLMIRIKEAGVKLMPPQTNTGAQFPFWRLMKLDDSEFHRVETLVELNEKIDELTLAALNDLDDEEEDD